jgi:antitoxin (DNA-binding transcriptional repressor) of toxin-antitoxin stability system
MKQVTMHQAKTHLSRWVDLALAGEDIIIARRNEPLVRLSVLSGSGGGSRIRRKTGALPGLLAAMGDRFNDPLEDWDESPFPKIRVPAAKPATRPVRRRKSR